MKRPAFIIGGVIVIAIIGAFAYVSIGSDAPESDQQSTTQDTESNTTPNSQTTGRYVDYHDGVIATTTGTKLLFFHAPWCPQCHDLEADIESKGVPDGVTIIKVDYDTNQALRQRYGVTLQTTVVRVDDEGNQISKFVAYDEPTLAAVTRTFYRLWRCLFFRSWLAY